MNMAWVWLGIALVMGVIELVTVQLATVWFALGALVSMVLAFCGVESLSVQVLVFVIVSGVALIATRPLVNKLMKKQKQPTNADRNIGKTAVVTEDIDNDAASGIVSLSGMTWTARSENGEVIPAGTKVTVKAIEGVKLIVEKQIITQQN